MKTVKKILGIYLAFLLQSLIFENLKLFSSAPDILLAVVIIVAVSENFVRASFLGAFAGLLNDVMYGEVFGINVLVYMYLALLVSLAADKKNLNSPLIMGWVCFVSIAAMEIIISIFKAGAGRSLSFGIVCSNIFVKGIFAGIFALIYVLILLKISDTKKKKDALETEAEEDSEKEVTE